MPELPEVETIRRGLERLLPGKIIRGVKVFESPKSFPNSESDVAEFFNHATVVGVRRRAKVLLIDLSSNYTLVVHLKMTGQLVYVDEGLAPSGGANHSVRFGGGHPTDSLVGALPDRFTRVVVEFTDGSHVYFNDLRKFGWMKLFPTSEVPFIDFMRRVGPEPLEDDFTGSVLFERLQRRKNTTIKAALLDQTVLAGVGNIYADESLWAVKVHPSTLVKNVPEKTVTLLAHAVKDVMNTSLAHGGSTDKNYVDAEGKKGSYLTFAHVFRREGEACSRCGATIVKLRVAGRGTHICPVCQRLESKDSVS